METNNNICTNCNTPFPKTGIFCGGCLTQIKCKSCNSLLEKDYLGCTVCGTPKENNVSDTQTKNANAFRFHETSTERTIEATFSDSVGKDIAEILKEKLGTSINNNRQISLDSSKIEDAKIDIPDEVVEMRQNAETKKTDSPSAEYPNLMLVSIKNLPSSEVEWVVVYSFYASNYGQEIYTRQDILAKHSESKRKNDSVSNNLARNVNRAINSGYINPLQEGYFLLEKGLDKAREIISRSTGSIPKSHSNSTSKKNKEESEISKENKTKVSSEVKSIKRIADLNLEPEGRKSLKDFFKIYPTVSDYERILIFVHYLEDILKIEKITSSHLYTCYDDLDLRVPENLPQTIRNTRSVTGWIMGENGSNKLTIKGRNKIKSWNKSD